MSSTVAAARLPSRRGRLLVLGLTIALTVSVWTVVEARRSAGYSYDPRREQPDPAIVHERPEAVLAGLVARESGLPPRHLGGPLELERQPDGGYGLPRQVAAEPASGYELTAVWVGDRSQTLLQALLDDDPTVGIEATGVAAFPDGTRRAFRLHTWRYGLFRGDATLLYGDGPPWTWEWLEALDPHVEPPDH